MKLWETNKIERVWANLSKHEGETFFTVAKQLPYTYVIKDNYIVVIKEDIIIRRISKESLEKALSIENPNTRKIGGWSSSYIYGIVTDSRIL